MNGKRKVLMVMPVMKGGGAERVASLLLNEFYANGFDAEFLLTSSSSDEIINRDLNSEIPVSFLDRDNIKNASVLNLFYSLLKILSSILCKPFEAFGKTAPVCFAYLSFVAQYHNEIKLLRKKLFENPKANVITFLQPAIPITLLAARGLPNRVIISERCDPIRQMKKRYGFSFVKKYYQRADIAVFQTNDAMSVYPRNIAEKGVVIPNPIKSDLPEPYFGQRNKNISTFCRISQQKNLPLLVEAFALLCKDYDCFRLRIIGDTQNKADEEVLDNLKSRIEELGISQYIDFLPFSSNVHDLIIKDALYVNSSDYEGMSNAMLEAMAIGMPVVCTDCPIGGAASIISNGKNGLLAEVGNSNELYKAIKKVVEDKELSDMLSVNAAKLRQDLSLENIAKRWMELL